MITRLFMRSNKAQSTFRIRSSRTGFQFTGIIAAFILSVFLVGCGSSGEPLSNVRASTDTIVPGSVGIGKPPNVIQLNYTIGSQNDVSIALDGPRKAILFTGSQKAGNHILRFNGTTASSDDQGEYEVVR